MTGYIKTCGPAKCDACPYGSIHTVGGFGPTDTDFVIVGESPGREELREGRPFIGKSGVVLNDALNQLPHPEPYVTNAHKCMPIISRGSKKDEDVTKLAVAACNPGLMAELASLERKPRVILAAGAAALWATTGNSGYKITRERGRLFETPLAEVGIVATVHPAFLLRGFGNLRQFRSDVALAMRLANGDPYIQPGTTTFEVVDSLAGMLWLARAISQQPYVAADIETSDLSEFNGYILCAGFTWDGRHVYVVPENLIPLLSLIFERAPQTRFIWHNGKFDCRWLWRYGIKAARVDEDTMLLSYANDERRGIHDLEQVSKDWLNSPDWKAMLDAYLPKKNTSYAIIPRPILYKYMAFDIGNTYWLFRTLRPMVAKQPHAEKLYTRTLIPASGFLGRVEQRGLYPDEEAVKANDTRLSAQIEELELDLNRIVTERTGHGVGNPNSHVQLNKVLYHDFGLKPPKGVESTDDDVLDELPQIPVVVAIRRYRKPVKARSTYVKPLIATRWNDKKKKEEPNPKYIVHGDGLIHTTFLIHGTPTGRLASRGPNTQNVPRDPPIRNQIVARPGRRLIEVDLNQAELRSLACLSGDETLCKIYTSEGMSLHEVTRASTFGQVADWNPLDIERFLSQFSLTHATRFTNEGKDRILEEQKMRAKAVNFGIVYGRTAPSLAEEFRVAVAEGQRWIDAWFGTYPGAHRFIRVCRNAPRLGKDLVTPFGNRKRHGIVSAAILTSLENEAANFPHQSIASNINLHGAMEMDEQLVEQYDTYIINLVHDSILMDAPDDDAICQEVIRLAQSTLEAIPPKWGLTRIPFKADPKIGYKWGSLSEDKAKGLMKKAA